jgi:DNA-binding beta-propeller fold protein YncE
VKLTVCLLLAALPFFAAAQTVDRDAAAAEENFRYGVQAFHRGYYNDAVVSLEKALSYKPSYDAARLWLGRTLLKSGYEQEALRTWEQLASAGKATPLLSEQMQILRLQSGVGRDAPGQRVYAVSSELDGSLAGGSAFKRPSAVRALPDGSFLVVAFGSNQVLHFDVNSRLLESLRGGLDGFDRPFDAAVLADGRILVSEYGGDRIALCRADGEKIRTFGKRGRGNGMLLGPQYLAVDGKGYFYVTDFGNARVSKFDTEGNWVLSFPGLAAPTGICVRGDQVFVAERSAKRIAVFDPSGNPLRTFGEGVLAAPEGLSCTEDGRLLVCDENLVKVCDLLRESWSVLGDASANSRRLVHADLNPNGELLGADFDQNRILVMSDVSALYSGLSVRIDKVDSTKFPEVVLELSVEDRMGRAISGLSIDNFIITESRYSVGTTSLLLSNTRIASLDAVVVVERSPSMDLFRADTEAVLGELWSLLAGSGRMKVVSAGERPVREADFGEARLVTANAAFQAASSPRWRPDLAVRMAGDELNTSSRGARKAVILLTTGSVGRDAFKTYAVMDLARFLRNNGIAFYTVFFETRGNADLSWLCGQTDGMQLPYTAPAGMRDLIEKAGKRTVPQYLLQFTSRSDAGFGYRLIPLEAEATVQKRSGRDEAGYFAPMQTAPAAR